MAEEVKEAVPVSIWEQKDAQLPIFKGAVPDGHQLITDRDRFVTAVWGHIKELELKQPNPEQYKVAIGFYFRGLPFDKCFCDTGGDVQSLNVDHDAVISNEALDAYRAIYDSIKRYLDLCNVDPGEREQLTVSLECRFIERA